MKFGEWQFCNFDEQCSPLALHHRRASISFQSRAWSSGRRVGTTKASACLLCASWLRYKPATIAVLRFLFSSIFQSPPSQLHRALAVDLAPLPSRQSLSQLRLFLAHPANQPWSPVFAENLLCALFFLAADNISVVAAPSWPALYGELLTSGSIVSASPWCRGALCPVN